MKPVINLDELTFESSAKGDFQERCAPISNKIGAKMLGYNLSIVPPGKRACPFHNHHVNEEMFFIVNGTGTLRFGDKEYPLRKHDIIACPPGKRDVAHQIINTGSGDLTYLSLSTMKRAEIVEYPDSNKIGAFVGHYDDHDLRHLTKAEHSVDYWDGEC